MLARPTVSRVSVCVFARYVLVSGKGAMYAAESYMRGFTHINSGFD